MSHPTLASSLSTACSSDVQIIKLSAWFWQIKSSTALNMGHTVAQLVETLRYKPEGHGFDSL